MGRVYDTARWQHLRSLKLSVSPLCEPCDRRGLLRQASHVDHVVSIASGGAPYPDLDGLMSMCPPCHSIKTNAKDRAGGKGVAYKGCTADGTPLDPSHPFLNREATRATLVCGPPGSGKTTLVARHRRPGDLVVDHDAIAAALVGDEWYRSPAEVIPFVMEARAAVVRRLASAHAVRHAWVIASAPCIADRHPLAESIDARVVVLAVSAEECARRINADDRRAPAVRARHIEAVSHWWSEYVPEPQAYTPLEGREALVSRPARTSNTQLVSNRDWSF